MDSEDNAGTRRKVKFAPRAPPRRVPKPEVKTEVVENDGAVQAKELMNRFKFNESEMKAKFKAEKKVSASQIAFGYGGESISMKSYGVPKDGSNINSSQTSEHNGRVKEYQEPWDYYSYYPVTLPLRRPYSGNPEFLDEEEFGESAESRTYDENSSDPAMELGLLEENHEASMFLIHLPTTLPMMKGSANAGGQDVNNNSKPPTGAKKVAKPCKLNELPRGIMGKMLVYKSGAIKLKLGDTLYDVSSGSNCGFSEDVVAMNTAQKHCCTVGEISKHATITPDVDAVIDSLDDL